MKRAYHLYCLLFIISLAQASDKNDENKIKESIASFLKIIKAENICPYDGAKVSLDHVNIGRVHRLGSTIKKMDKNTLELNNAIFKKVREKKYSKEELLKLQLKSTIYLAERISFNYDPHDFNFVIINPDCATMLLNKRQCSKTKPSPQKICIITQLLYALNNPSQKISYTILNSAFNDLGIIHTSCSCKKECEHEYTNATKRLKAIQGLIPLLPKKARFSNALYLQALSTDYIPRNTLEKHKNDIRNAPWGFHSTKIGIIMNIFRSYGSYDKTPLHYQTAKAALGLYDEITC